MKNLLNIKPARGRHEDADPIADLDALESQPIRFRFNKKIYTIKPIDTLTQFKVSNMFSRLGQFIGDDEETLTGAKMISHYTDLFKTCCPEIERKDVETMSIQQLNALMTLILEHIMGKAQVKQAAVDSGDPKKKA